MRLKSTFRPAASAGRYAARRAGRRIVGAKHIVAGRTEQNAAARLAPRPPAAKPARTRFGADDRYARHRAEAGAALQRLARPSATVPMGGGYAAGPHHRDHRRPGQRPFTRLETLERAKGFEPSTPTLARLCSTPELRPLWRQARKKSSGRVEAGPLASTSASRKPDDPDSSLATRRLEHYKNASDRVVRPHRPVAGHRRGVVAGAGGCAGAVGVAR